MTVAMVGGTAESWVAEVRIKCGKDSWGGGGRTGGDRSQEEKIRDKDSGTGLKHRGPNKELEFEFEFPFVRRRGGNWTEEIGNRDFHSSEYCIFLLQ